MDENAEAVDVEQEVDKEDAVPEKEERGIQIIDVENPAWISKSQQFVEMSRRFVEHDLKGVPSITPETFINYCASIVDGICKQKLAGVHDKLIQTKIQVGFVDEALAGFQVFHMLTNRMPHVQTLNWAYLYSENPTLTSMFADEVERHRKEWKAIYVFCTFTNERLQKVSRRILKKASFAGMYYVGKGVRHWGG